MGEKAEKATQWITDFLEYTLIDISGHKLTIFNVFILLSIYFIVKIVVRAASHIFRKRIAPKYKIDDGKAFSIMQLAKYLIYVIAFTLGLESLGINISLLLAGSAALLVGLGLGIQDTFKDFVSGLILLFEGSLKVGDVIEVDTLVGVVKEINLRTSKVRTRDGIIIIVPNSSFINEKVINWSSSSKLTRFHITVGVAYGSDVKLVKQLLIVAATKNEQTTARPKPFVRFADFGESSLNFELYFWTEKVWIIENTKSDLRFEIDQLFRDNNIHIPFPQRDLHIKGDLPPKS